MYNIVYKILIISGRAGYTLDELFILIRSKVLQQRHIGLRTLANILRNAKEGLYDTAVNPPIIQLMVSTTQWFCITSSL